MAEKFPGSKNPHELSALEKEVALQGAESFEQLYAILDKIGPVKHGSESRTPAQLKEQIEQTRLGGHELVGITHTYGLNKAVKRILQHERRAPEPAAAPEILDAPVPPDASESPAHAPEATQAPEEFPTMGPTISEVSHESPQKPLTPTPAAQAETPQTEGIGRTSEGRNTYLEKVSGGYKTETPGEFRRIVGGMLDKMRGLKAASRTEATGQEKEEAEQKRKEKEEFDFHSVRRATKLAEKSGVHESHSKIHEVEGRYLDLYKKYHSFGNQLLLPKHRKEFLEVSKEYNQAKLEHANALQDSVAKRLDDPARIAKLQVQYDAMIKTAKAELHGEARVADLTFEKFRQIENEKLIKRYNGWIRYKEVFRPSIEAKQNKLEEIVGVSGKALLEKAGTRLAKSNQWLEGKLGKNGARSLRLVVMTAAATGAGVIFGGVGLAGALGFAGTRLARSAASMVGGTAIATGGGKIFEGTVGGHHARGLDTAKKSSITNLKELKRHEFLHTHGSAEGIAKDRQKVQMALGLLTGLGLSHEAAVHASQIEAVQKAAGKFGESIAGGHGFGGGHGGGEGVGHGGGRGIEKAPTGGTKPAVSHEKFPHHPSAAAGHASPIQPSAPKILPHESLQVDGKINNANRLMGHFAEKLKADYSGTDSAQMPKSVKTYLDLFKTPGSDNPLSGVNENNASLKLGLWDGHKLSEMMHPGDTVELNQQGQVVINWADHARAPHVLVDAEGTPNTNFDDLGGSHMTPVHHAAAEHAGKATHPSTSEHTTSTPAPREDPSDALNRAAVGGTVHTSPEVAAPAQHIPETIPTHTPEVPVAPDQSTVENLLHSFTNPLGTPVDSAVPHIYDGGGTGHDLVIYGGTPDEQVRAAEMFIAKPENVGKTVWVEYMRTSQLTGTQELVARAFSADANGLATQYPVHPGEGYMPKIDPAAFARRIT